MGNQPSVPKPGTELQVIGSGLSRTGTASFSEALRILLDGPVYHGGTQVTLGKPVELKSWIEALSHWPPVKEEEKKLVYGIIKDRYDGFAACTDAPANGLTKELLDIYPNAKVICTVRDADAWEKSMAGVASIVQMWFFRALLLPLPGMRHFVDYIDVLAKQWIFLYREEPTPPTKIGYNRHIEWLKETVPKDRLLFFDVREGWEPLCKALGKPVPEGVPFPRINDGEAIDRFSKRIVQKGLIRWLAVLATGGLAMIPFIWW